MTQTPTDMSTDMGTSGVSPFAATAMEYKTLGFDPIPLPVAKKSDPPMGWTGKAGAVASGADIQSWIDAGTFKGRREGKSYGNIEIGNIAARMTGEQVVLDVDGYNGKSGAATLKEAERHWGVLPHTIATTSRHDGVSAGRFYRIPAGTILEGRVEIRDRNGDKTGGIDILQRHHRYAVVAPSIHPITGETYRWIHTDGWIDLGCLPSADLPLLPQRWIDGLRAAQARANGVDLDSDELADLREAMTPGEPSATVQKEIDAALAALQGDNRYDSMVKKTFSLLCLGVEDHPGVRSALQRVADAYVAAVSADRDGGKDTAEAEFLRAVTDKSVRKLLAEKSATAVDGNGGFFQSGHDEKRAALVAQGALPPAPTAQAAQEKSPAGGTAPAIGRSLALVTADDIEDDVPDWVWTVDGVGRIQQAVLSLFAGRPGAGKSTAARWFAAQWTRGALEGIWHGQPQNVAYIASEESLKYVVKPGLRAAGADMKRIFFPKVTFNGEEAPLIADEDEKRLTAELLGAGVAVVIVDPVMATIEKKTDIYRNNELRAALAPWTRTAEAINGTVAGVVHLKKGTNSDVVGAINGSSGFGEVARCVFGFVKNPESDSGERVMSQVKNSCGPEDLSRNYRIVGTEVKTDSGRTGTLPLFVMGEDSDTSVEDILGGGMSEAAARVSAEMQRVVDFVNNRDSTGTADLVVAGLATTTSAASKKLRRAAEKGLIDNPLYGHYTRNAPPPPKAE